MDDVNKRIKNINPYISKELYEKLIKDPGACKAFLARERAIADRVNTAVMKVLCSKEFLSELFKKEKK